MIHINLLPPEELKSIRFQQRKMPIIPFLIILFFLLFMYWIGVIFSITYLKSKVYNNYAKIQTFTPRKAEVDTLWDQLHNKLLIKKQYIETIIIRPLEWAQVLNIISDFTSQGIWLHSLDLEKKDDVWLLTFLGFAKPVTSRSMIKDVGNYVTNVKDNIETSVLKRVANKEDLNDFIEVTTTTKRKKADTLELTEFITTFKITL